MKRILTSIAIMAASATMLAEATELDITLPAAGTLKDYITPEQQETVTKLKVSGDINGDDLRIIRHMIGAQVSSADGSYAEVDSGACRVLDLADANIVSGGCYAFRTMKNANGSLRYLHYLQPRADAISYAMFIGSKIEELTLPRSVKYIGSEQEISFSENDLETSGVKAALCGSCIDGSNLRIVTLPEQMEHLTIYGYSPVVKQEVIDGISYDYYVDVFQSNLLNSPKLSEIILAESNGHYKVVDGMLYTADLSCLMLCPQSKEASSFIDNKTSKIAPFACRNARIEGFDLKGEIGIYSFQGADINGDIKISCRCIANSAFADASIAGRISLSQGCDTIGISAFRATEATEVASFPSSLKAISDFAFYGSRIGGKLTIPAGVDSIGRDAYRKAAFRELELNNIAKYYSHTAFKEVRIHAEFPIGYDHYGNAVYDWTWIDFRVPYTVSDIFAENSQLSTLTIGSNVEIIPAGSFKECTQLSEISLPIDGKLEEIGDSAFFNTKFKRLILPKNIRYTGKNAFQRTSEEGRSFFFPEVRTDCTVLLDGTSFKVDTDTIYMWVMHTEDRKFIPITYRNYAENRYIQDNLGYPFSPLLSSRQKSSTATIPGKSIVYVNYGDADVQSESLYLSFWNEIPVENWVEIELLDYPNYRLEDTSVEAVSSGNSPSVEVARYDIMGRVIQEPQPGLNIVVYSDGNSKKIFVK